jgi:hypothetical protein
MNKTLYNLYIKTTKEDKTKVYAIHMSGEMQPNKTKAVGNTHIRIIYNQTKSKLYAIHIFRIIYNQTKPVETKKLCNFFTFICHSCLY